MAYKFSSGFDFYTTASQIWDSVTGVITINAASARFTGTHSQGASVPQLGNVIKNLSDSVPTLIIGVAVKLTALPTGNDAIIVVRDSGTIQCSLAVTNTGALQFLRGTATAIGSATSGGVIVAGVWNYIEIQVTINNTTGIVQAWLNGVQVINSSGVNNRNGTPNTANQIGIGEFNNNPGAVPILFDDLYCFDTSGPSQNAVMGDTRIITVMPAALGDFAQFTPNGAATNWQCVNEIPPDDNTTFVADSTLGDRDSYVYDTPTYNGSANFVVPWGRVTKDDAGSHTVQLTVRSGGVD